ncbi:hypothetical protein ACIOHS_14430 [Streptomyces sp. NPDC088253]|uniref:hypothetical protein n=1 Tax=Streptomyces sp. NPDC088253 TaxID=3365846 RepID=UPI00381716E0
MLVLLQLPPERHRVVRRRLAGLGEADLHQVVAQLRLDVLPRQELLAPVGVLLGAGHRDIPGPQLLGERGEHHGLESCGEQVRGEDVHREELIPGWDQSGPVQAQ